MWRYSIDAMKRFLAPLHLSAGKGADVVGHAKSGIPGEQLALSLQIDEDGVIQSAHFDAPGSAGSVASTDALLTLLMNRHIAAAASITEGQLERFLGELPESRLQSPVLGLEALRDAYRQWVEMLQEAGKEASEVPDAFALEASERRICFCLKVSEGQIRRAIREGELATIEQVTEATRAGSGCRGCHPDIAELLNDVRPRLEEAQARKERLQAREDAIASAQGDAKKQAVIALIEDVLDADVRPKLALDGGDVQVLGLEGQRLLVAMQGACKSCSSVSSTLQFFVQDALRQSVDPRLEVVAAEAEQVASAQGEERACSI